ncbi:acyltransferase family protein [Novosphingobium bradum]|uniref:Acyltransferase family protein n=1 Tax=Novosphingobium bradum TaxID=1737444 RepID=A0ABV7ILE8_9SPHN
MGELGANRLGFVESLRLLAAALVVLQHLSEHYPGMAVLAAVRGAGPGLLGVYLFFLISGYVVPMSVKGGLVAGPFLVRRLFRVYPALLAAFALAFLLGAGGVLPGWAWLDSASLRTWAANLALVQDYAGARPILGVTWTLGIEFAWYGLFALAVAQWGEAAARRLGLILPALLLALCAVSLGLAMRLPLGRITFLYACVLGFLAFRHDRGQLSRAGLLAHGGGFVVVLLVVDGVQFGLFRHGAISLAQVIWPSVVAPALFLGVVLAPCLRAAPLLARGVVPALGAASYSVYLLHPLGIALGDRVGATLGPIAGIAVSLAATALLALLGYRLVERPGIALGRRLLAGRAPAQQPVPAQARP